MLADIENPISSACKSQAIVQLDSFPSHSVPLGIKIQMNCDIDANNFALVKQHKLVLWRKKV